MNDKERAKIALEKIKAVSTMMLQELDACETRSDLARILRIHLTAVYAVIPNDTHATGFANVLEFAEMMDAFLDAWESTGDVPTIAHQVALKRHDFLKGLFDAMEQDLMNGDISVKVEEVDIPTKGEIH